MIPVQSISKDPTNTCNTTTTQLAETANSLTLYTRAAKIVIRTQMMSSCTQTKCIIIHLGTEKKFYTSFLPYSLPLFVVSGLLTKVNLLRHNGKGNIVIT